MGHCSEAAAPYSVEVVNNTSILGRFMGILIGESIAERVKARQLGAHGAKARAAKPRDPGLPFLQVLIGMRTVPACGRV